jgi:hypothetical protein
MNSSKVCVLRENVDFKVGRQDVARSVLKHFTISVVWSTPNSLPIRYQTTACPRCIRGLIEKLDLKVSVRAILFTVSSCES